jgi:hypothetical protein
MTIDKRSKFLNLELRGKKIKRKRSKRVEKDSGN